MTPTTIQSIQQVLTRFRLHTATIRKLQTQRAAKSFYDKYEVIIQPGLDNQTFIELSRGLRSISPDITLIEVSK